MSDDGLRNISRTIIRGIRWERVNFLQTGVLFGVLELCRIGHLRGDVHPRICNDAKESGYADILEWALANGYQFQDSESEFSGD
jgi:hypothetical protein